MINYKKRITLSRHSSGDWYLHTDKGDRYEAFAVAQSNTKWSQWWGMQHQSDLRLWQKDILREFANSHFPDLTPYVVYKKHQGHSQPHDIAVAFSEEDKTWLVITSEDFWIVNSDYGEIILERGVNSCGCITDPKVRETVIYPLLDVRL